MARYKYIDTSPRLLPVDLSRQLVPGSFVHTLNHLLDGEIDLSHFDARFINDDTGAPAYPPAMLLKVILYAYSQGIVSSRGIERACCEQVTFIALTGDNAPHFTTIARFIATLGNDIAWVFAQVLFLCDSQGLIGREMFAIDGVKLPSNASKAKSGTCADFAHQAQKLETSVKAMLKRHRDADELGIEPDMQARQARKRERLIQEAAQLRQWLKDHPADRTGSKGSIRKSNRTDNDSAKLATGKGVIQGYTGVAAVDSHCQIIVEAQAHGTGSEQELLLPVVEAMADLLAPDSLITADAGYHSEKNLQRLHERGVEALIADKGMRMRDERFADQARHRIKPDPLANKAPAIKAATRGKFQPSDFIYDAVTQTCTCPAGKQLYANGKQCQANGRKYRKFTGAKRDCVPCPLRANCLRTPDKTAVRQVALFYPKQVSPLPYTEAMKQRMDSPLGRLRYGLRLATVEPVFANLRHNKKLSRFTLRGREKVDAQWKLFCLVHNIEKLAHHRYAQ
ncbi:IS1182 family transposase [Noviherbaspirillum massiliense]|uniref:IS1182 family transposase n=1 Tax=Noviherbaspirillum massiliense TaxID=1465823 RepID=UPI0002D52DF3|nr:IS1182 family transposase [Noviherbaspirillum massiliense]